jgi:hypothetical protein
MQRLEENLSGEAQRLHEEQHTSLVAAEGTAQEDTDVHHARADIYATAAASLAGWACLGADGAPLNEINEERHAATSAALHKPEEQKASNAAADYTSAKESTGTSARSSGSTRIQTPAMSSDPDFEPMIAAIVGEARGKRGERFYQVVQSIIIPDTVEELRAARGRKTLSKLRQDLDESDRDESDDNGDELGPMVSPADAGVKAEPFRSTQSGTVCESQILDGRCGSVLRTVWMPAPPLMRDVSTSSTMSHTIRRLNLLAQGPDALPPYTSRMPCFPPSCTFHAIRRQHVSLCLHHLFQHFQ